MATYGFHEQIAVTDDATAKITAWLKKNRYAIINVEKDKAYQHDDIDLLALKSKDGKFPTITKVEIKADTYESPNYFAEYLSNDRTGALGCWFKTKSDIILYYFVKTGEIHMIPTKAAQRFVQNKINANKDAFKSVTVSTGGSYAYHSKGYLVPKAELRRAMNIRIYKI